ncbi:MAG: hypothetical protein AB7T01_02180 [Acidithiobacillus sp.]
MRKNNPHYVDQNPYGLVAILALPFYSFYSLARGLADPYSRPAILRWTAILLFIGFGIPLLFFAGAVVAVFLYEPHQFLAHVAATNWPAVWKKAGL